MAAAFVFALLLQDKAVEAALEWGSPEATTEVYSWRARMELAVGDEAFDAVTMAFGIRNVPDVGAALKEIHRVLRPGGRALILEFSLPANRWIRRFYLMYFRHVLPRIGGLISGDGRAYRYLNRTVEDFPYGRAFGDLMCEAGFREIELYPLTFGVATLYQGDK